MNRLDEAKSQLSAVHPPAIAHYNMGVLWQQRGRTQAAIRFLTAGTVPAGGLTAQRPQPQAFPAETAQAPLGHSPRKVQKSN